MFGSILIGAGLGIALLYGLGIRAGNADPPQPGLQRGARAPGFILDDLAGQPVKLSDFTGRVVLLNFWATWCAPCRDEMPLLQQRHAQYAPALAVIAVNFDEPLEYVQAFAAEFGLTFTVLLDPGGAAQDAYAVRGYPTTVLVDAQGIVRIVHIGAMSEGQLDEYLAEMGLSR